MVSTGSLNRQIKGIKLALKQQHLYTDEEIRYMKRRLRECIHDRTELNKGYGFGN